MFALIVIGLAWFVGWRAGCRWCEACGVDRSPSVWVLGTVLPTASVILSVHALGTFGLFFDVGLVTPGAVAMLMVAITAVTWRWINRPDQAGGDLEGRYCSPGEPLGIWALPIVIVIATYAVFALDALTRFPTGYDGLNYHLPIVVSWINSGRLDLTVGLMHESLPENAMILPMLLLFAKAETLLNVVFAPFALVLGVAVYELAIAVNAGRRGAVAAACIALSIPIVVFQSFSSYVDLFATCAWLLSLLGIVWASRSHVPRERTQLLILAGLSAGVALGCKTTYLVLAGLLPLIAVWTCKTLPGCGHGRVAGWTRTFSVFGLAMLVCSGFWFVRGAVQAGNPIYPLGITLAGEQVLPGFVLEDHVPQRDLGTELGRWWNYPWREIQYSGTGEPYSVNNALGAPFAAFVPLGIVAALARIGRRKGRRRVPSWLLVNLSLIILGVALFLTVYSKVLRYVLPLIVLGPVVAAPFVARMSRAFPRGSLAMLVSSLAITSAIAVVSPVRSFAGRVRDGQWGRAAFYEIPPVIDSLEPGSRILSLAPAPLAYPLLGANLTNEVLHGVYWENNLSGTPMNTEALLSNDIDYVYVREPWPTDWPTDLPVELIFDDTHGERRSTTTATRIYRVLPSPHHSPRPTSLAQSR